MNLIKDRNLKIIGLLIFFVFIDQLKPLNYFLHTEFIFLGIVILTMNYSFAFSFVLCVIFGYLKDCLAFPCIPASLMEFPLICVIVYTLISRFNRRLTKIFIFIVILTGHIILNNMNIESPSGVFSICFFIHSFIIFLGINYLLKRWNMLLSEKSI